MVFQRSLGILTRPMRCDSSSSQVPEAGGLKSDEVVPASDFILLTSLRLLCQGILKHLLCWVVSACRYYQKLNPYDWQVFPGR